MKFNFKKLISFLEELQTSPIKFGKQIEGNECLQSDLQAIIKSAKLYHRLQVAEPSMAASVLALCDIGALLSQLPILEPDIYNSLCEKHKDFKEWHAIAVNKIQTVLKTVNQHENIEFTSSGEKGQ